MMTIKGVVMSDTSPLILHGLTKCFGHKLAVDNVSLELHEGEVFGFLGPNGAGKSTTIRSVMDFLRPTDGWVELLGGRNSNERTALHDQVGYLAGDIALYETMTGRKLLKFLARTGRKVDWRYVDELAERFEAALDRPIRQLSKGNRQKIGLIQAFMHRPKLLILDEPTSGLDPLMKQVFYDLVREVSEQGATVFVSSHDLAEVQKICHRAGFIRDGKLIAIEHIATMKHLSTHRYIVTFAKKPSLTVARKLPSITDIQRRGDEYEFTVKGDAAEFVSFIAEYQPKLLRESELELEELFMRYYEGEEAKR